MKKKDIKTLKLDKQTIAIANSNMIKGGRVPTATSKYTVCGCVTARSVRC
ncbi:hypothetical protein [Aquimarina sp. AU474]|nr:hypothetical protein [Aquimarina sp. AU474]